MSDEFRAELELVEKRIFLKFNQDFKMYTNYSHSQKPSRFAD